MAKVLFLVGSLRKDSFNHQMAQEAEKALAGKAEVSYLDISRVPFFNQDLETPVLPEIAAIREQVAAADAIWIFSPAYNHAIPGVLKNTLDWLSRSLDLSDLRGPSVLQDKLVTVSSVANGTSSDDVFAAFNILIPWLRTKSVGTFTGALVNPEAWGTNQLILNEQVKEQLAAQAADLLAAI